MSERCAVIGIGQTKHTAVRKDKSIPGLLREAAQRALADAVAVQRERVVLVVQKGLRGEALLRQQGGGLHHERADA